MVHGQDVQSNRFIPYCFEPYPIQYPTACSRADSRGTVPERCTPGGWCVTAYPLGKIWLLHCSINVAAFKNNLVASIHPETDQIGTSPIQIEKDFRELPLHTIPIPVCYTHSLAALAYKTLLQSQTRVPLPSP